jgi:DNA-binding transcriptional ArsR family regulator
MVVDPAYTCQPRRMSKQPVSELPLLTPGCCPPLAVFPLSGEQASGLAPMFKALGDPVRLRLLSMIASQAEVCVCELTDATGVVFARSDLPEGHLPDSFAPETILHLGDDPWLVKHAEPSSAAEFIVSGRLVLTVRRLTTVSPQDVLYSLPTICHALPAVGPAATRDDCLELHEDDWRQVELVSRQGPGVFRECPYGHGMP